MDSMTKIVILTEVGFSQRDYFRWGIKKFKKYLTLRYLISQKFPILIFLKFIKKKFMKLEIIMRLEKLIKQKILIDNFKPAFAFDNMTCLIQIIQDK